MVKVRISFVNGHSIDVADNACSTFEEFVKGKVSQPWQVFNDTSSGDSVAFAMEHVVAMQLLK
jgi:hypothetical protein